MDRRRHGNDAPQYPGPPASLRVGAAQLSGGSHYIGGVCRDRDQLPCMGEHIRQVWQKSWSVDLCLLGLLLWPTERLHSNIWLALVLAGPCRLWHWRNSSGGDSILRVPPHKDERHLHHDDIVCAHQIFWTFGATFEVLLALLIMPTLGWRWLLGVSTLPLAIFICFSFWLPESPRFDLLTGNTGKAMATLKRVAKENGKTVPQGKVTAHKQRDRGQIKDLLTPRYWKTTLLLWFIWFANAFSYYGIILLTTELFQTEDSCGSTQGDKAEPSCNLECNYLTLADYKDLLWTTLAEFPGVLFFIVMADRIGRKKSMALGFFVFAVFILPLYACIRRFVLTIFIFIARAFINAGFQVAYVYTPEVFPTENRALAMGTCGAMSKLGSLLAPFVSELILRKSRFFAISMYCGCCLLAAVASLILPTEMSGKGLQESDQEFDGMQETTKTKQ